MWVMAMVMRDLVLAWSADADGAFLVGRGGEARFLRRDGSEESELDHLLRRTRAAAPIVPARGLLRKTFARTHYVDGVGDAEACARLGDMYASGDGVPADEATALRWYATAAEGGHEEARYRYASWLAEGIGCKADPQAARAQLELLGSDSPRVCNLLGSLYQHALGDPVRARALYEQAAGDDQYGLAIAQFNAGQCWRHGIGGPADLRTALRYFELAAAKSSYRDEPCLEGVRGAAELNAELARISHEAGNRQDHVRARKRAIRYFEQLAEYGDAAALIGLARCHLGEYGGQPDESRARAVLERALAGSPDPDIAALAAGLRARHRLG
jgi:TPR repeat protein